MPPKNNPFFSIIVPAYNVAAYLPECIASVLSQSWFDFELILVDDGSTDQTGAICDQSAQNQPNLITIHQPNSGLSAARNTGIVRASGEYLILLDGDDYLEPDALKTIHDALEPHLDLLRYQTQEVFPDGKKLRYAEAGFASTSGIKAFTELARYHYTENAWLYAYRREFFMEHGFQYAPGCIAEDLGLTPLILARAQTVKAIPDICYNYRQRTGSIMHDPAQLTRRTHDIMRQFEKILPEISAIPGTAPILHYLVVSFLTGAAQLSRSDFLRVYQDAKTSGFLRYIHPSSPKALPRALLLRYSPSLFYRLYH